MGNFIRSLSENASASSDLILATTADLANVKINSSITTGLSARVGDNLKFRFDADSTLPGSSSIILPTDGSPGRWILDKTSSTLGGSLFARAATISNITLSNAQTIDGVALAIGDRCLVKNQSSSINNGLYIVLSGTWERAGELSVNSDFTSGLVINVSEGNVNGNSSWYLITSGLINLGVTSIDFNFKTIFVSNIANLRNIAPKINSTVNVLYHSVLADNGGGVFAWDSTSTATDNNGTVIQATGISTGRWLRNFSGPINVRYFGAVGNGTANDTVAIASAIALASANSGTVLFSTGIYMTDTIILAESVNDGITFLGEGRYGQFGGTGSKIKLRSASTQLISIQGLRYHFSNLTFDGNTLPSIGVVRFRATASEIEFNAVNIQGAGITGGPNPSNLVIFDDTSEIDNVVFRRCRIAQNLANGVDRCPVAFKNFNPNAFNISIEYCHVACADILFYFSQGSCDVRHTQVFEFTTAAWYIGTYAQSHVIDDVYTERNGGTVSQSTTFYQQGFSAGATTSLAATIKNTQINDAANIFLIGTQPIILENVRTGGSIFINPAADQALTGTVTSNGTTAIVGSGTSFLTEAPVSVYLRINNEIVQVASITDNTHLTLATPMQSSGSGFSAARTYGFNRVTTKNVLFLTPGTGFTGTGYPSQVDEDSSIYYGNIWKTAKKPQALSYSSAGSLDGNITIGLKDGEVFYVPTLTSNRVWTLEKWMANPGNKFFISVSDPNHTLTINYGSSSIVLQNATGKICWVSFTFDTNQGWLVSNTGRRDLNLGGSVIADGYGNLSSEVRYVANRAALQSITPEPISGTQVYVGSDPVAWIYDRTSGAGFAADGNTIDKLNSVLLASNGRFYRASSAPVLSTIASLRLAVAGIHSSIQIQSYSSLSDEGGGHFDFDPNDTTSTDDGGYCIVAGTKRYKRRSNWVPTAKEFGAKGDVKQISVTMSSGTNTFTASGFTAADVGKDITIQGAGTSGATHTTTISNVVGTTIIITLPIITSVTATRCFYGSNDTAAIVLFLNYLSSFARHGRIPAGRYFTDHIVYNQNIHSGISLDGDAPAGQFGGQGTQLILRTAQTALLSTQGIRLKFRDMLFDGNRLATDAVVRHRYITSGCHFYHCYVTGIQPGTSGIHFVDDLEVDNVVWELALIAGDIYDFAYIGGIGVYNTNINAFMCSFERPTLWGLDVGFRYRLGSCDVRDMQIFGIISRKFQIDQWCNQFECTGNYEEGTANTFIEWVADATVVKPLPKTYETPVILRGMQIRTGSNIISIGTQPLIVKDSLLGGGIKHEPAADIAHAGTLSATMVLGSPGASTIVGVGTDFLSWMVQFGTCLRINGEELIVYTVTDDTHATLLYPGSQDITGVAVVESQSYHNISAENISFTGGAYFYGTGFAQNRIEISGYVKQFQTRDLATAHRKESFFEVALPTSTASQVVNVEKGVSFNLATCTVNTTVDVTTFNAVIGNRLRFSRFNATDGYTLTIKSIGITLATLVSNQFATITYDGTVWRLRQGGGWPDLLTSGKGAFGSNQIPAGLQSYTIGDLGVDEGYSAGGAVLRMHSDANASGTIVNLANDGTRLKTGGGGYLRVEKGGGGGTAGDLVYSAWDSNTAGTTPSTIFNAIMRTGQTQAKFSVPVVTPKRTAITTPVTVIATDRTVITNLTSPGAVVVNLPAAPLDGQEIIIKDGKGDAGTNNITINGNGANIDGYTSYVLNTNFASLEIVYDSASTNWRIINNIITIVPTIAALRNSTAQIYQTVQVQAYATLGDGGGGIFDYDSSDTTSADNGGTIITAGTRRYKLRFYGPISVKMFGAKMDGSTNDTSAVQAAINTAYAGGVGGTVIITRGVCIVTSLTLLDNVILQGEGKLATYLRSHISSGYMIDMLNCDRATVRGMRLESDYGSIRMGTSTKYCNYQSVNDVDIVMTGNNIGQKSISLETPAGLGWNLYFPSLTDVFIDGGSSLPAFNRTGIGMTVGASGGNIVRWSLWNVRITTCYTGIVLDGGGGGEAYHLNLDGCSGGIVFTADSTTDTATATAHGMVNGTPVCVVNTGGSLPGGLIIKTVYYVVNKTSNTFQLSLTAGGSAVDITSNGTGVQTVYAGCGVRFGGNAVNNYNSINCNLEDNGIDVDFGTAIDDVAKPAKNSVKALILANSFGGGVVVGSGSNSNIVDGRSGNTDTNPNRRAEQILFEGQFGRRSRILTYAGTVNIDWVSSSRKKIILTGDVVFTWVNLQQDAEVEITVIQDASGNHLITWPATAKFSGVDGTASTAASTRDVFRGYVDDGNIYFHDIKKGLPA